MHNSECTFQRKVKLRKANKRKTKSANVENSGSEHCERHFNEFFFSFRGSIIYVSR
jgi:hypothetical protein